jgi:ArsR family transcriptional regulator
MQQCRGPLEGGTGDYRGTGGGDPLLRAAGVLAALSDPVRLRIFSIIASQDETCSCNLEGPLGKSQPTISHHTHRLAAAGLIVGERRGRWTWWRAVPEQLTALGAALGTIAPGAVARR